MSTEITAPVILDPTIADDGWLNEHAGVIRMRARRAVGDIVEIGNRLITCRDRIREKYGHGNWYPWLEKNFGWSVDTADRYMHIAELGESRNLRDLDMPVSSLYLLAAPSTPEEVRDEIFDRAEAGERISATEAKKAIAGKRAPGQARLSQNAAEKIPAPIITNDPSTDKPEPELVGAIAHHQSTPTDAVVLRDWKTGEEHVETDRQRLIREGEAAAAEYVRCTNSADLTRDEIVGTFLAEKDVDSIATKIFETVSAVKALALGEKLQQLAAPKGKAGKSNKPFNKTLDLVATSSSNRSRH
jgi:hypothetical protein